MANLENHGCKFTHSWETAIKPTCVCVRACLYVLELSRSAFIVLSHVFHGFPPAKPEMELKKTKYCNVDRFIRFIGLENIVETKIMFL
jgi:hypothetical protein